MIKWSTNTIRNQLVSTLTRLVIYCNNISEIVKPQASVYCPLLVYIIATVYCVYISSTNASVYHVLTIKASMY